MDGPVRTEVRFVAGFDGIGPTPPTVRKAGFTHRFAVIQETYRPDSVDMYFDEPLWTCLLEFACDFSPEPLQIHIGKRVRSQQAADDKGPEQVEVRSQGQLVLFIAPEL